MPGTATLSCSKCGSIDREDVENNDGYSRCCNEPVETLRCMQFDPANPGDCTGPVEYRMPLSGTGASFPRCDGHWDERLQLDMELRERYPANPPSDWSPLDAGESWDEEDY